MPQGRPAPGTPQDWLAQARSDLALARLPREGNAILAWRRPGIVRRACRFLWNTLP